jgi:hypothetical protein
MLGLVLLPVLGGMVLLFFVALILAPLITEYTVLLRNTIKQAIEDIQDIWEDRSDG